MKNIIFLLFLLYSSFIFADEKIDWAGFYGSAMVGRVWGNNQNKHGNWIVTGPDDQSYLTYGNKTSLEGWSGNLKLGYNKQIDNNLIGIELGGSFQNTKTNGLAVKDFQEYSITTGALIGPLYSDGPAYGLYSSTKVKTYETLNLRLGHIINDKTLVFITGGAALGQIENTLLQSSNHNTNVWFDYGTSLSNSKTELGYTLGLGVEQKINKNLSLRANYEYVNFGDITFNYADNFSFYADHINYISMKQTNSINFSNLTVGISYTF